MKLNARNVKLAWKYRHFLWKYRNVIRHRREIAGAAVALGAVAAGLLLASRANRVT
jgi:hypothetical protein